VTFANDSTRQAIFAQKMISSADKNVNIADILRFLTI
jgi:hypothetical protein